MKGLWKTGALITGLFSGACCLGPAVFTALGVVAGATGFLAGMAGWTKALIPFRFFFIVLAAGFIAASFYAVYTGCRKACDVGDIHSAQSWKRQKIELWILTAVVLALVLSSYWV